MADFSFKLEGVADLEKALDSEKKIKAADMAVKKNAAKMQQDAMREVPVKTGYLKASIGAGMTVSHMYAKLEPFAHYAAYVELGTRFMDAHPYLRPAWLNASQQLVDDLHRIIGGG